jgi:hypothetical protein
MTIEEPAMAMNRKTVLALAAAATLLGACATGPYYDEYGYGYGYDQPGYGYGYGYDQPGYAYPGYSYYSGPTVGFGIGFSSVDRDGRREWRDHRGDGDRRWGRDNDRDHDRDRWRDRDRDNDRDRDRDGDRHR